MCPPREAATLSEMVEPAPPLKLLLASFVALNVGVYVSFTALALETYLLLPVAAACFAAAFLPALKLVRRP
jgi:hypothetical protein